MLVSAMFVETMTLLLPGKSQKDPRLVLVGQPRVEGEQGELLRRCPCRARSWTHSLMASSPGRKIRMSPGSFFFMIRDDDLADRVLEAAASRLPPRAGRRATSTGYIGASILTMGHSSKYSEKTSALIVAEETMTLNSGRAARTPLSMPRMKSMLRLRSCASSTMMTL